MPQPEVAALLQRAVLWEHAGVDEFSHVKVAAPVELRVRWVNVRRQQPGAANDTVSWDVEVMTDRAVKTQSVMWEGRLRDVPADNEFGGGEEGLFSVDSCDRVPDLRNRITGYELKLSRLGTGLPTVVT